MEYRNQKSMSRWQASLISGIVIAAGFYASTDLEKRKIELIQTNNTLKTIKQNYVRIEDSATLPNSVKANKGMIISRR